MKSPINISSEEWNLIEDYLNQKSELDKDAIMNKELTSIPNIEEKIAYIEKVKEEIEDSIRQSKIKEFHEQLPAAENYNSTLMLKNKKTKSNAIWYAMAAVLVVLLGIFWMMNTNSPEKIFAKNFKPDIGLPLKMGTTNSYNFYEGMLDYKQENYTDAISKWQDLWKENPESDTLNYFLGVAHLAQGNAPKALVFLENQEKFQQSYFEEDAAYYAALAKIKEGKFEDARLLLKDKPSTRNTKLLNEILEQ